MGHSPWGLKESVTAELLTHTHRLSYRVKSKSDREGEISYDIPYMWNLKRNDTNKLTKQNETHRLRK